MELDQEVLQETYKSYAKWYDFTFGKIIQPGRKKVISKLGCKAHDSVLEVGVGTGLSLPLYRKDIAVTGIDLSDAMLDIARNRVKELELDNIELHQMNAQKMEFEDNSFDKVVALYVASVVPDPEQLISEIRRVCKPDGEFYIVNHFYNTRPIIGSIERLISPLLARLFGFQPCMRLDDFLKDNQLVVEEKANVNFMGNWTFLKIKNNKLELPLKKAREVVMVDTQAEASSAALSASSSYSQSFK